MSTLTIGSICSGYGGLDMALEDFFGAETAWFAEFDPAPSKVLAHHWPTVPNLGDITAVDWASVEPVDIIAGGTPCQDLSAAGRRKGMTEGTRSNLWVQMREAVAVIRPSLVVWENVRGAFSAYATSEVESESGLLGVYGLDRPALRALGRVLGDLSDLGYDAEWVGVRASDAGAPHGRFRVFVLAYTDGSRGGRGAAQPGTTGRDHEAHRPAAGTVATDSNRGRYEQRDPRVGVLPFADAIGSTTATDAGISAVREYTGESFAEKTRSLSGDGPSNPGGEQSVIDWGPFAPAIQRWESLLGRTSPNPTEAHRDSRRLSAVFEEWMMGLPSGWVTDPAIGLTWRQQVKALGNGVVPQQAELALSILWARMTQAVAA